MASRLSISYISIVTLLTVSLCVACATDVEKFTAFFNSQRGTSILGIISGINKQHHFELYEVNELAPDRSWKFVQRETKCVLVVYTDLRNLIKNVEMDGKKRCRYIDSNFLLQ